MAEKGWKDVPLGGLIVEEGNSKEYQTGSWRTQRPVIDLSRCTNCLLCWVYCPDASIVVEDGKVVAVDLEHCKGCGICFRECARKAISLTEEG